MGATHAPAQSPEAGQPKAALPGAILFLCGQNSIRSPIAEQIARAILPASVYVASAGVKAGARDPFVDAVLAEAGLSLGARQPQAFDDLEDDYFDVIVTLAPEAHHLALDQARAAAVTVEYWPTADPTTVTGSREHILAAYRDVFNRLRSRIQSKFGV
ncbi:MAG: low molecular weight phosphatase family protein [Rhizobiaceae bacterium]